jgi:hypothetical protein
LQENWHGGLPPGRLFSGEVWAQPIDETTPGGVDQSCDRRDGLGVLSQFLGHSDGTCQEAGAESRAPFGLVQQGSDGDGGSDPLTPAVAAEEPQRFG